MRCQNCVAVEQQLNGSTVFKKVPDSRIWRRGGKMLVYVPETGGTAVIEEAEQPLYRQLGTPRALAELVSVGPQQQVSSCLVRWHRQGVVQMLGKTVANPRAPEPSLWVRWFGEAAQAGLSSLPVAVKQALASRSGALDWAHAEQTDWNSWAGKIPEKTRVLEACVTDEAAVDELAQLWQRSQPMKWQRLLVHAYLDKGICDALLQMLQPSNAEAIPAEVMAYCPVSGWDDYRPILGYLLRSGVTCLPVGCPQDVSQLESWLDKMLAARYRTIGVCQRGLLQGDVLRDKERFNALAQDWTAVMDRVEAFYCQNSVRLRVYPLERLLLALLGDQTGIRRCEVQAKSAGALRWVRHQPGGPACERCLARTACRQLEDLEVGNSNCWLRKKIAEELLWRWHNAPACWQDVFWREKSLL